jgi:hypothetical protein
MPNCCWAAHSTARSLASVAHALAGSLKSFSQCEGWGAGCNCELCPGAAVQGALTIASSLCNVYKEEPKRHVEHLMHTKVGSVLGLILALVMMVHFAAIAPLLRHSLLEAPSCWDQSDLSHRASGDWPPGRDITGPSLLPSYPFRNSRGGLCYDPAPPTLPSELDDPP